MLLGTAEQRRPRTAFQSRSEQCNRPTYLDSADGAAQAQHHTLGPDARLHTREEASPALPDCDRTEYLQSLEISGQQRLLRYRVLGGMPPCLPQLAAFPVRPDAQGRPDADRADTVRADTVIVHVPPLLVLQRCALTPPERSRFELLR